MSNIIRLNVGGSFIETTQQTLQNIPNSMLATMFSESKKDLLVRQTDGSIFIDADINIFRHILQLCRRPNLDPNIIPFGIDKESWYGELNYWCINRNNKISFSEMQLCVMKELITLLENSENFFQNQLIGQEIGLFIFPNEHQVEICGKKIDIYHWLINTPEKNLTQLLSMYCIELVLRMKTYICKTCYHGTIACPKSNLCLYRTESKEIIYIKSMLPKEQIAEMTTNETPFALLKIKFIFQNK